MLAWHVAADTRSFSPSNTSSSRPSDPPPCTAESATSTQNPLSQILRFPLLASGFACEREGDVHARDDFEKSLEDGGKVHARATAHSELLIAPPLLQGDPRPLDFQNREQAEHDGDGEQVGEEHDVELRDDELTGGERGGKRERGEEAVHPEPCRSNSSRNPGALKFTP
jgi:hypothetical protein